MEFAIDEWFFEAHGSLFDGYFYTPKMTPSSQPENATISGISPARGTDSAQFRAFWVVDRMRQTWALERPEHFIR